MYYSAVTISSRKKWKGVRGPKLPQSTKEGLAYLPLN